MQRCLERCRRDLLAVGELELVVGAAIQTQTCLGPGPQIPAVEQAVG
jgi:hypothetical protein